MRNLLIQSITNIQAYENYSLQLEYELFMIFGIFLFSGLLDFPGKHLHAPASQITGSGDHRDEQHVFKCTDHE